MKRRDFIQKLTPVLAAPFVIGGLPGKAFGRNVMTNDLATSLAATDRILVLIQLTGGNDGLNTVISLDQYSAYSSLRSNIMIPEKSVLKLSDQTGLHPSMTGIKSLFDNGQGVVVQGVTYPNSNFSHFRSTDIFMSGSDSNQYLVSGWAGRFLGEVYPNYPIGYPNPSAPDPLAIQIGASSSLALQGAGQSMGLALQDPNAFYSLVNGTGTTGFEEPPNTKFGKDLKYIREIQIESLAYSKQIKDAASKASNKATYPTGNSLADQLKIVARLIGGGLQTRIYSVSLGGFDTHAAQVVSGDTSKGNHAILLQKLSEAITAFLDDIRQLGADDKVLAMTYSEFGRRVASNASAGTDHGTAAPMFLFGKYVKPGIVGANPSMTDLDRGNLKMQYDFRQIYTSVLAQWFGAKKDDVATIMLREFQQLPLINAPAVGVNESQFDFASGFRLYENYPNPVNTTTSISYDVPFESEVLLTLTDVRGRTLTTLVEPAVVSAGHYSVQVDASNLPEGAYFFRFRAGAFTAVQPLIVSR